MTCFQLVAHYRGPPALGRRGRTRHACGDGFAVDPALPRGAHRRAAGAARRRVAARADRHRPGGLDGGHTPVRIDERARRDRLRRDRRAAGDRPAPGRQSRVRRHGNLYVTFSGSRGQQAPVAIFVVRPDGTREPFVTDLPNPTSLAFDRRRAAPRVEPVRRQRVSRRRRRTRHDGARPISASRAASRSGRTARSTSAIDPDRFFACATGARRSSRRIPPSVAAFHLAFGPDGWLYVTAPTLGTRDCVYRISPDGRGRGVLRRLRPPAGAGLRRSRAICTSSTRSPASSGLYRMRLDRRPRPSRSSRAARSSGWRSIRVAALVAGLERHGLQLSVPIHGLAARKT